MNPQAILIVQWFSLILAIFAIALIVYIVKIGRTDWKLMLLPMLLILNVLAFLSERILLKSYGVHLPVPTGSFNTWAVLIQFQLVLTAVVAVGFVLLFDKKNGK